MAAYNLLFHSALPVYSGDRGANIMEHTSPVIFTFCSSSCLPVCLRARLPVCHTVQVMRKLRCAGWSPIIWRTGLYVHVAGAVHAGANACTVWRPSSGMLAHPSSVNAARCCCGARTSLVVALSAAPASTRCHPRPEMLQIA